MGMHVSGQANFLNFAELFRQRNAGSIRNDGDVREIGGFAIDVTGAVSRARETATTAFQPGPGGRTYKPDAASPLLAPDALSSMLKTQDIAFDRAELEKARNRAVEEAYVVSVPETVTVVRTEDAPVEQITSLGYFDRPMGSRAEEIAYIGDQIDRLGRLADIERELSAEQGAAVKLAWDPVAEEYLALKPGQAGYDRVKGAQELLAGAGRDLGLMGCSKADFRDVLERYGVKV